MTESRKKIVSFMLSLAILSIGACVPIGNSVTVSNSTVIASAEDNSITIDDLPSEYKESMDWVWENRILDEQSTERWNLIFDQIVAGDGTLNYVIRWQSSTALTYEQRQKFATMLERQINAWTDYLVGFEGWNFDHVNVNVVGWAVSDESLILDKHDDEVVYTTTTTDELHNSNSSIPELLPYAPTENSRAEHYADTNYQYPDTRFDMYLWGTTSFEGGAGGDWGQRVSDEYILQNLDSQDAHIIEHEIGHGFGMTDFYDEDKTPTWPENTTNIMVSGWATEVTDYDGWMLRYIWDKIKDDTNNGVSRFNLSSSTTSGDTTETSNSDGVWNFNVSDLSTLEVTVKGEAYSGVSGNYYLLDNNGNTISQSSWHMSESLGENGEASFSIDIPTNATTLKVETLGYFVWDNSTNDFKDLPVNSLDITINGEKAIDNNNNTTLLGDVNLDGKVSSPDALVLKKHLLGIENLTNATALTNADMNLDGSINIIDLCMLKKTILFPNNTTDTPSIPDDNNNNTSTDDNNNDNNNTDNTDNSNTDTDNDTDTEESSYIVAPISSLYGSLPSQGDASLVIFYVDFPDCTYSDKLSTEELQEIAFGSADEDSSNYPFESMTAFYLRSSKGALNLTGQVFSYTAKYSISYYNENKVALAEECFDAFDDTVDFSIFDSDGDGSIDATLFTVPNDNNDDNWWPCAGGFGDDNYTVDGVNVGHIITGNATPDNVKDFNSSYLHEMGHCFGLPDYYLYYSGDDFDSMNGSAGTELMDGDAYSDFGAFSKLMLGWYKENQVQVYDSTSGTQTFTLTNAQTDNGNCVIIPYGTLDSNYFSEYFIIEYSTDTANNSAINTDMSWWQSCESGIRIYHIKADMYDNGWWKFLKYENGSEFTNNDDDGIRLIRLVNDGNGCFKTGDTVDSSTSGFGWYDSSENESIDPNVKISIGELNGDSYTITITPTN